MAWRSCFQLLDSPLKALGITIYSTSACMGPDVNIDMAVNQKIIDYLDVENTAGASSIPKIKIVETEIIHRSEVYFSPLLNRSIIDASAIWNLMETEYRKAGVTP